MLQKWEPNTKEFAVGSDLHPVLPCVEENPFLLFFCLHFSIVKLKKKNKPTKPNKTTQADVADRSVFTVLSLLPFLRTVAGRSSECSSGILGSPAENSYPVCVMTRQQSTLNI